MIFCLLYNAGEERGHACCVTQDLSYETEGAEESSRRDIPGNRWDRGGKGEDDGVFSQQACRGKHCTRLVLIFVGIERKTRDSEVTYRTSAQELIPRPNLIGCWKYFQLETAGDVNIS